MKDQTRIAGSTTAPTTNTAGSTAMITGELPGFVHSTWHALNLENSFKHMSQNQEQQNYDFILIKNDKQMYLYFTMYFN